MPLLPECSPGGHAHHVVFFRWLSTHFQWTHSAVCVYAVYCRCGLWTQEEEIISLYIYIYKKPLNGRFDDEIIQSIEKEGAWQHLFLTLFHEKFSALWVKMPGIKKGAVFLLRIFNGSSRLCSGGHGARSLHSWCSAPDV